MKKLFTFLFAISIGSAVFAQTANVSLEYDSVQCSGDQGFLFTCDNHVINGNTADSAHLKWVRYEEVLPAGWATTICDPNNCYSESTNTKNFSIKPNFSGILKVNFIPNGNAGSGIIRLHVSATDNGSTDLDAWFFGSTLTGYDAPKVQEIKDILVYPTPVLDNAYVVFNPKLKPSRLEVYNLLGQKIKSLPVQLERNNYKVELQLSELDKGLYFIRVYQDGVNQVITKQFTKE